MNQTGKQASAIACGTVLAVCAFLLGKRGLQADRTFPGRVVQQGWLALSDPPSSSICSEAPEALLVCSEALGERLMPRVREEWGVHGRVAFAEYGRGWAERRRLTIILGVRVTAIDLHTAFDTDYGDFLGVVDAERSSVHRHDDLLCFDLAIERCDSSATIERWRGVLRLR